MKLTFFRKFIATVSLGLTIMLGVSGIAFAEPMESKDYKYDDKYGGTLGHYVNVFNNGSRGCEARTENWRYGRLRGSYTRVRSFGAFGGLHADTGRVTSFDGHASRAVGTCPKSWCDGHLCRYETNCGPRYDNNGNDIS